MINYNFHAITSRSVSLFPGNKYGHCHRVSASRSLQVEAQGNCESLCKAPPESSRRARQNQELEMSSWRPHENRDEGKRRWNFHVFFCGFVCSLSSVGWILYSDILSDILNIRYFFLSDELNFFEKERNDFNS